ncbi:hypothetical protein IEQ34_016222 [Dendrobium chrysotoxum]|uniref:Cyclin N-terminal domain-containing protein n=1 Tax=Dendrobium chrysotoxum TaxID=161865 RepID=A0AAV7GF01_DENCH|nr:hypothetical protein IEQ34_016222 [Dendrobium chrysotoxum]
MASKHDAMVSLQKNAEFESKCNGKATVAEGIIRRAFRDLKNIVNVAIYELQISSTHVKDKNFGAADFAMKAGRKGRPKLADVEDYDIDSCDVDNDQFALAEYVEDLYKFYKTAEKSSQINDYMNSQVQLDAEMRANVSYWLIQVHEEYQLMPETLYLTLQIMDRYLSIQTVKRRRLQFVGISSMLIACKYVEKRGSPKVHELVSVSRMTYNTSYILKMEKRILTKLDWSLTVPTMYVFLVRFIKAAHGDKQMEQMTFFFSELALMHYSMIIYKPSMVAASAVYAARCTLRILPYWTKTLEYHTGFKSYQLINCTTELLNFQTSEAAEKRMKSKKYSELHFDVVTLNTPALMILEIIKNALVKLFLKIVRILIDLDMFDIKLSS